MSDTESEYSYDGGGSDIEPETEEVIEDNGDSDTDVITDFSESESEDEEQPSKYNRDLIRVHPDRRMTSNRLTQYEMTEIVSIRAVGIEKNNNCMVDITGLDTPILQAKRELMMRKCPLMCRRLVGSRVDSGVVKYYCEDWNPNTMEFAVTYPEAL